MKELYAIIFKDTGEILTPDSFKEYWKNYGSNSLQGWNPPKKIYYTLGRARSGFAHIPDELKEKTAIANFVFSEIIEDGAELKEKQYQARKKKEEKQEERNLVWKKARAEAEFKRAQEELDKFKDK